MSRSGMGLKSRVVQEVLPPWSRVDQMRAVGKLSVRYVDKAVAIGAEQGGESIVFEDAGIEAIDFGPSAFANGRRDQHKSRSMRLG